MKKLNQFNRIKKYHCHVWTKQLICEYWLYIYMYVQEQLPFLNFCQLRNTQNILSLESVKNFVFNAIISISIL